MGQNVASTRSKTTRSVAVKWLQMELYADGTGSLLAGIVLFMENAKAQRLVKLQTRARFQTSARSRWNAKSQSRVSFRLAESLL
mmetsp:Transcript_5077/g.11101  ORF Transcript_5077/g.11101 Transcript_5077/m.11101 type:complete len:84 (-) Transcript_5077:2013-2264(-)